MLYKNTNPVQKKINIVEITYNEKTGVEFIMQKKKSKIVSDNTISPEGLGDYFKNLCKKGHNVSKKMANSVLKYPRKALEVGTNVGTAFASRSPKAVLSSKLKW